MDTTAGARSRGGEAAAKGVGMAIATWRIEEDPRVPGRLCTLDEEGRIGFVSRDGGRSWMRPAAEEARAD